jgi:putative membrane protein
MAGGPRDRPVNDRRSLALLILVLAVLVVSGIGPHDRTTWWLEVSPVVVALPILVATRRRFPLTALASVAIVVHAVILCVGGHFTYARVPLGEWVSELAGWQRNHYDRLGHFAQGFVPALVAREVLLRTSPLRPGKWLAFLVVCVAMAVSAAYELVEWGAALVSREASEAFLGTQGDPWDTQADMFLALLGAVSALALLSRAHDRQLARLQRRSSSSGAPSSA